MHLMKKRIGRLFFIFCVILALSMITFAESDSISSIPSEEEKKDAREDWWIEAFAFQIEEPKAGEKIRKDAKALHEGYHVTKVVWTPADSFFIPGKEYKVEIFFDLEQKYYLLNSIPTTINNKVAIQQGRKDGFLQDDSLCAEYTFPVLEGKLNSMTWSKASNWAMEELIRANDMELIPEILKQEDLTTAITRKEFAHIAVRLWESITGKTASPVKNTPFTDCDDIEVLKAYRLEITKGTSDTTFSPDALITREQVATMMTRALQKAGINTSVNRNTTNLFEDDEQLHSWGKESVYFMAEIGIIKGTGGNNFGASGNASREQAIVISFRSVEKFKLN
jgi:hypothetical protein